MGRRGLLRRILNLEVESIVFLGKCWGHIVTKCFRGVGWGGCRLAAGVCLGMGSFVLDQYPNAQDRL